MNKRTLPLVTMCFVVFAILVSPTFAIGDSDRILVWVAPAPEPGTQFADQTGELAFLRADGSLESVVPVPQGANRVDLCGEGAVSPNKKFVALFLGNTESPAGGGLYIITDGGLPQQVTTIQAYSCIGTDGHFRYSPDSNRFGYIDYAAAERTSPRPYAAGNLKVFGTGDFAQQVSVDTERVVGFDLVNDGAAYLSFFTDDRGRADEAVLNWWDGSGDRELTALLPAEGCEYVSGYVKMGPDHIWMILGEKCGNAETQWQLFRVGKDGSNALLALTLDPDGALSKIGETNNLIFSRDGSQFLYTLPDGFRNNTVGLYVVPVDDLTGSQRVIREQIEMPTFSGSRIPFPSWSPDGRWLALATFTLNEESAINVIDLENPTAEPFVFPVGRAGEIIQYMEFAGDNRSIVYMAGGERLLQDNSVFVLDRETGESRRVARGTFSGWAVLSPDGNEIAIMEWKDSERASAPDFLNLDVINIEDGSRQTLFSGEVYDEEEEEWTNSFAKPIYWFR